MLAPHLAGMSRRVSGSPYSAAVLALTPYTYWKFSETSGANCADEKAVKAGTATNTYTRNIASLLTTESSNKAINLATNGYISIPNTGQFLFNGWSYGFVIKIPTLTATAQGLFHIGDQAVSGNQGLSCMINSDGTMLLQWFNGGWQGFYTAACITAATVLHVIFVFTSATTMKLYVNNSLINTYTLANAVIVPNQPMKIGAIKSSAYQNFLTGTVDDSFSVARAISAAEVASLWAQR